jgi:hypothetical protein
MQIQKDIALKEEMKRQEQRIKYEEGKAIKDKEAEIKRIIEGVRQSKVKFLSDLRIPEKYQADLNKRKF